MQLEKYHYFLFRLDAELGFRRLFLTAKEGWTSHPALAWKGTRAEMQAAMLKLKESYPDLILERLEK